VGDDPPQTGQATEASIRALADFLHGSRGDILASWERTVRKIIGPSAETFDQLVDPFGEMLDHFAVLTEGEGAEATPLGERHAPGAERAVELGPLVTGYVLLRDTIVDLWVPPTRGSEAALRTLDQAIDRAILGAVARYASAQDAAWRAIERVSALGRQGGELSVLLDGLLRVVLESTAAADCGAVFLREGDDLRLRATRGFEEDLARGLVVKVGEGLAGTVATRRAPVALRWAARDPLITSEAVRRLGVRAMYGVPLLDADELVGVVMMGSLTTFDFSEPDRRLFALLADRATAGIQLQRLRDATAEQERRLTEVEDAVRARDRTLSTMAHEVRTPIGIVLMQADSLAQRPIPPDDPQWLPKRVASIHRAAERIDRLVEELVEFTNLRAGRLQCTIATHQAADLVREAVELFTPAAQERGITLETDLSAGLPSLSCDRERILQVLSLLATNAMRVLPDGGLVTVRAQHDDRGVVFSVEDSGPPVDDKELPHLFDRAWHGERGKPGRSGVGLGICKGIVEAHGGRIWASHGAHRGVILSFVVPTARA
jgi:signal transduction histidine kinase